MFASHGSQGLPAGRQVTGHYSAYIHIPFCKKKCNYCDFVSYVGQEELIDAYVARLCQEIASSPLATTAPPLQTIYFGGGTPTLLEPKHFEKILSLLFPRGDEVEISIEANPGTADLAKLKALRSLGINRLSIGIQSFNDRHLKTLGRIHAAAQALNFYHQARRAGFAAINLDLIFALPGQTLEEWKKDLAIAVKLEPEHLSAYNLIIEAGTPFHEKFPPSATGRLSSPGVDQLPDNETEAVMFEHAIEKLTGAGYRHYEISNFAQPGYECQHNLNYWQMGNWLGFGAGAHSQVGGWRWENPPLLKEYLAGVKPPERIATTQGEKIMMGLRFFDGIPKTELADFKKEMKELIDDGLLEEHLNNLRLTRRGLFLGNLVFEKFT